MPNSSEKLFYQVAMDLPLIDYGEGVWLIDAAGKRYLDGSSGAIVSNLGHAHPRMLKAMHEQASKVSFAYRTQFESHAAIDLAEKLCEHLSQNLNRVFYVSGGSEAVESAIKLARQYHVAKGDEGRYRILSRFPSYHGSTLGALSATGYSTLNEPFEALLYEQNYIPAPTCYRCPFDKEYPSCKLACAHALEEKILELGPETIAAFILEPIGGASTAAIVAPDEYFEIVSRICKKYGILTIYDEVMTGAGRTGKFCAYQHWDAHVDILALAKGLGAGYSPLGAVVCRSSISEAVLAWGGFRHGHTYAGNPLSCAIGLEALKIIEDEQLCENATKQGDALKTQLLNLQEKFSFIGDVRGKGLLLGVEFVANKKTKEPFPADWNVYQKITQLAFQEGLIIYPRRNFAGVKGDHVLIAPPLTINDAERAFLISSFESALEKLELWLQQA